MSDAQADGMVRIDDDIPRGPVRPDPDGAGPWKVLIVDDESEVHDATVFALSNLIVHGCALVFLHAKNELEAQTQLERNPDVAVILLDVVMEAGDSGLRLVKRIRDDLRMDAVRIVLRTGQPGYAPELDVIQKYDINDYKTKLELTRTRLATAITAAIRSYNQIRAISVLNSELELRVQERTRELQAVNRQLESYSYCVAHDLRAPLRHIMGFSGILRETLSARLNADDLKLVEKITKAAARMGRLIEDLLEFTRVGRAALKKGPVDLNNLVAEVIRDMQQEIGERPVAWSIATLPSAIADKSLLRQVLANLLSNAVKYTRSNAETRIEVGILPPVRPETAFVLFVRDNGVGFDMEHADKLFQPFSRLHAYAEFEGTGVGLSIVHNIIERHGGKTWAEGQKGVGAIFYFTLPA